MCLLVCLLYFVVCCFLNAFYFSCFKSFDSSESFDSPVFFLKKHPPIETTVRLEHADSRLKRDRSLAA